LNGVYLSWQGKGIQRACSTKAQTKNENDLHRSMAARACEIHPGRRSRFINILLYGESMLVVVLRRVRALFVWRKRRRSLPIR